MYHYKRKISVINFMNFYDIITIGGSTMKIKKDSKFLFYLSLTVFIGIIALDVYRFFYQTLNSVDLVMDLLMLFVLISCIVKFTEKKIIIFELRIIILIIIGILKMTYVKKYQNDNFFCLSNI